MPRDEFNIQLSCPSCKASGVASCWQKEGWAFQRDQGTRVTSVTLGFTRVNAPSSWGEDINFTCNNCGELCASVGA